MSSGVVPSAVTVLVSGGFRTGRIAGFAVAMRAISGPWRRCSRAVKGDNNFRVWIGGLGACSVRFN
jgi:hypothetical protein